MSTTVYKRSEIPDAPYYVLSNDTFMSGWGPARGKINTVILPCESMPQAEAVAAYARSRTDQKRVRIVSNRPRLQDSTTHLYSLMVNDGSCAWYPDTTPDEPVAPDGEPILISQVGITRDPNLTVVTLGDLTVWFSYNTLVGFMNRIRRMKFFRKQGWRYRQ